MGINYGPSFRDCKTALDIITKYPVYAGLNGFYMVYPEGINSTGQLVWCDMTTDGGGWMLVARSHPSTVNYNGKNWGWRGGSIGSVKDYSQAYQAGWWDYWDTSGATFTSYIFGNRENINNNNWGYFIYKVIISSYNTFTTSDTQQTSTRSTLKFDTSVYDRTTFPSMQSAIGFPITGTSNNIYYMRDCCGYTALGGLPTSMSTVYCGSDTILGYSGPWCGGSSTDESGNFLSGTFLTAGGNRYGGTNQYMIMVR
jgi:hypothetical protein